MDLFKGDVILYLMIREDQYANPRQRLTKEQRLEMARAAEPLIKWMQHNCLPNSTIFIDQTGVELTDELISDNQDWESAEVAHFRKGGVS
jgi:hypothetical protein